MRIAAIVAVLAVSSVALADTVNYWRFEEKPVYMGVQVPPDGTSIKDSLGRVRCEIVGDVASIAGVSSVAKWSADIPTAQLANPDPLDLTKTGVDGYETATAGGVNVRSLKIDALGNNVVERRAEVWSPSGAFTVEAYVKRDNGLYGSVQAGAIASQSSINVYSSSTGWGLYLQGGTACPDFSAADGALVLGLNTGSGWAYAIAADNLVTDDQWHHVAGVRDAAGNLSLYIDGVAATVTGDTNETGAVVASAGNYWFGVGGTLNYAPHYFGGNIDELRFSDAALSPGEMLNAPEPATMGLLAVGSVCVLVRRKRSR